MCMAVDAVPVIAQIVYAAVKVVASRDDVWPTHLASDWHALKDGDGRCQLRVLQ